MRVTRGLFASLGASGSVAAAGAFALLALSTFIGVRGWPGGETVRVAPKTLVVADATAPRAQRAGRASSALRQARLLAATEPVSRPVAAARGRLGSPARATAPRPPAVAPKPAPAPVVSEPSRTPTPAAPAPSSPVAQTVRDTGATAGAVVTPVSPPVGQTVTQATDTVAGVVDGVLKP